MAFPDDGVAGHVPDDLSVRSLETGNVSADRLASLTGHLDDAERARLVRLVFAEGRRDFAAAHGLLRELLAECLGEAPGRFRFGTAAPGIKPRLTVPKIPAVECNITHTRGFVACALVRRGAVGIDAETIDRSIDADLVRQVLGHAERAWLRSQPEALQNEAFLRLWTLKEAILKAAGTGLACDPRLCVVMPYPLRILSLPPQLGPVTPWYLRQWRPTANHVAAVAWRGDDKKGGAGGNP